MVLVLIGVGYVVFRNIHLQDTALQRSLAILTVTEKEKLILKKLLGAVVITSEHPKPWLESSFLFQLPSGEILSLQTEEGWEIQPGILTLLQQMKISVLLLVEFFLIIGLLLTAKRWHFLLKAGDIDCSFWNAFRLTSIGVFFNAFLPGSTGGDLAKAFFIVGETEKYRQRAVLTVVIDRIIGLVGLLLLACGLVTFHFQQFRSIGIILYCLLAGLLLGTFLAFNSWLRDFIRLEQWITKIPLGTLLKKLDEDFLHFRKSGKIFGIGLLLSMGNHFLMMSGCYLIGSSLGDPLSFKHYLVLLAVGNIIISIPVFPVPGGLGVREIIWGTLFLKNGSSYNMGVVLATTFFLLLTLLYSLGGVFLLTREGKEFLRWKRTP
ncbi:MAG: lysylphosphatidylglycerol synthase transmembrane domain-containing protein [Planctomycetota bacterium]